MRVFDDQDADGRHGCLDECVSGIGLRLVKQNGNNLPNQYNGGTAHQVLMTNADGIVTFTKVPRGLEMCVKVTNLPNGAIPTLQNVEGSNEVNDSDLRSNGLSDTFKIEEGSSYSHTSTDLSYLMPVTMHIHIWDDADADGLQDNGELGIPGIKLRLVKEDRNNVPNQYNGRTAHTEQMMNADGIATFTKVPQALTVHVKVTDPPNGAVSTLQDVGSDDAIDSDLRSHGLSVTFQLSNRVCSGSGTDISEVDLGYLMPKTVIVHVWDDADVNGLQDDGETGIPGIMGRLVKEDGNNVPNQYNDGTAHTVQMTNADGIATFTKVPQALNMCVKVTDLPNGAIPTLQNVDDKRNCYRCWSLR